MSRADSAHREHPAGVVPDDVRGQRRLDVAGGQAAHPPRDRQRLQRVGARHTLAQQTTPTGSSSTLLRSKGDQEAKGRLVGVRYAPSEDLCAVRAVRAWMHTAAISEGPVFAMSTATVALPSLR